MFENCSVCEKENPGPHQPGVQFKYEGLAFTVSKLGDECIDCAGHREREFFDRFGAELIERCDDGTFGVNWEYYVDKKHERRSGDNMNVIGMLLVALGVFSYQASGNWEITTTQNHPIHINPFGGSFFVRREDAEEYARLDLAGTLYRWEVRHIAEVVYKDEVLAPTPATVDV